MTGVSGDRILVSQAKNTGRSGISAGFFGRADSCWRDGFLSGARRASCRRATSSISRRCARFVASRLRGSMIRIGGLTTWSEVIRAPLPRCFDALESCCPRSRIGPDSESRHGSRESVQRVSCGRWGASTAGTGCGGGVGFCAGSGACPCPSLLPAIARRAARR